MAGRHGALRMSKCSMPACMDSRGNVVNLLVGSFHRGEPTLIEGIFQPPSEPTGPRSQWIEALKKRLALGFRQPTDGGQGLVEHAHKACVVTLVVHCVTTTAGGRLPRSRILRVRQRPRSEERRVGKECGYRR